MFGFKWVHDLVMGGMDELEISMEEGVMDFNIIRDAVCHIAIIELYLTSHQHSGHLMRNKRSSKPDERHMSPAPRRQKHADKKVL